jgi:hypothetical protein
MATQTRHRVVERLLDLVLAPHSPAEAAYRSVVLAPGFRAEPGLDLRYLGGKTIPRLAFTDVYLGSWDAAERTRLDRAIAAAMADPHLNNVLAQYFPGGTVGSTFAGSHSHPGSVPPRVYRDTVEAIVSELDRDGALAGLDLGASAVCLLLPEGAVLVDGDSGDPGEHVDSTHGLGGYHGSVHVRRGKGGREAVYYAVAVYSKGANGVVAFAEPWQNVCATLYHELCEIRTDPDVEDAIRAGATPGGRAPARLVLAARRRDRRRADGGGARHGRPRDEKGAARGRERHGADPADVVERRRRPGRADQSSARASVS